MTEHEIEALAHRTAWRYKKSGDPAHSDTYTFNRTTLLQFARALEHGLYKFKPNGIKNECTHPNCNCWMGVCGKGKVGGPK